MKRILNVYCICKYECTLALCEARKDWTISSWCWNRKSLHLFSLHYRTTYYAWNSKRPCSGLLVERWFNVLMKSLHSCMFPCSLFSCKNKYWPSLRGYLFQMILVLPWKQRWDRSWMWRGARLSADKRQGCFSFILMCILDIWWYVDLSDVNTHVQSKYSIKDLGEYCPLLWYSCTASLWCMLEDSTMFLLSVPVGGD